MDFSALRLGASSPRLSNLQLVPLFFFVFFKGNPKGTPPFSLFYVLCVCFVWGGGVLNKDIPKLNDVQQRLQGTLLLTPKGPQTLVERAFSLPLLWMNEIQADRHQLGLAVYQ